MGSVALANRSLENSLQYRGEIKVWRNEWVLQDQILAATTTPKFPELNMGAFYFIGNLTLYNIVPDLMISYSENGDVISLEKLITVGIYGDWLAKAKAWSAILSVQPDVFMKTNLLDYKESIPEGRENLLQKIAAGIQSRIYSTEASKAKEAAMQQIVTGKVSQDEVSSQIDKYIEGLSDINKVSELDKWFGKGVGKDSVGSSDKSSDEPNTDKTKKSHNGNKLRRGSKTKKSKFRRIKDKA